MMKVPFLDLSLTDRAILGNTTTSPDLHFVTCKMLLARPWRVGDWPVWGSGRTLLLPDCDRNYTLVCVLKTHRTVHYKG